MPTFLKDLTDFQLKLIWQNASVELSEAKKIVFIGYSLPQADYEIRQLLARMIPHDAEIELVMRSERASTVEGSNKIIENNTDTLNRYQTFFGKRIVTPVRLGAEGYVSKLL